LQIGPAMIAGAEPLFFPKTILSLLDNLALRRPRNADLPALGRDAVAGVISAVVQLAYCISFAALIFTGPMAAGFSLGLAALIMGTAVTCLTLAFTSSFSPAVGGPDSPTAAVMSVVAGSVAAALTAKGASDSEIVVHVLVALTVSAVCVGVFLFSIGGLKLGEWLRFIPYPVIGGFLAASGLLLITGGTEVITQSNLTLNAASWCGLYSPLYMPQIAVAALFALSIPIAGRYLPAFLALPATFLAYLIALDVYLFVVVTDEAVRSPWFLPSLGNLSLWMPLTAVAKNEIDWSIILHSGSEIASFCAVSAIALLLDASSLEVARQKSGDLDQEYRANGYANLFASVTGGFGSTLSMDGSLLLSESGGNSRWAGAVVGLACALVLFSGADIGSVVPKAILGGMLIYLGFIILVELVTSPAQHAWSEWLLIAAMTIVITNFGYFMGVLLGVIGACLMFALSYSRIGVVRRHLTRQNFASNVERSPEQSRLLQEEGVRVHVFWLSGFIFFGSSNGLYERIRRVIEAQTDKPVGYVVLDFSNVPGLDTSAVLSLIKLRNYCDEHNVTLAFSGLNEAMRGSFERAGFFTSGETHQAFGSRNEAVEWCEDMLLMYHEVGEASAHSFETWLMTEFGGAADMSRIAPYLERHEVDVGDALFRQGDPANSVEILASGCVAITIQDEQGRPIRLRRMLGYTVVGEMGFYRQVPRGASVLVEEPSVVYRMTRESFDRMQAQDPAAASVFHKLIIRLLSDRLEFANREIAALL
jgi:SulP family sulfate permease